MSFRYEETGVDMDQKIKAAPEGVYTLIVREASDEKDGIPRINKNGDNFINVQLEIDDVGEWLGNKVWHNVTFWKNGPDGKPKKAAWYTLSFLKAIGQPHKVPFDVVPENWIGKTFKAKLVEKLDLKGRPKNEIAYIVTEESTKLEDEIPF